MNGIPDRNQLLETMSANMPGCVLGAAAELDLFTRLGERSADAEQISGELGSDRRATAMLLDALAAMGVLDKQRNQYQVPEQLRPLLQKDSPDSILPMVLHRMNMLRAWSQLAWVVKAGIPAPRQASIRGAAADREAFIAAMHTVSGPAADEVVSRLGPPTFSHLLDVGGASGTWTLAFLRAMPGARATIFDLPDAIAQAEARIQDSGFADRIDLVAGDFYDDDLPSGADLAWVSAIVHQHSRQHNRALFQKVFEALQPGGRIAIRDIVMDPDRTSPPAGAMFAINMLVGTQSGGTFTFEELAEDLAAAGFEAPDLTVKDEAMSSIVTARRP
jgi:SAM-dependent methyltransferase